MVKVRIFGVFRKKVELFDTFLSSAVPRKGEKYCLQYWTEEIIEVEWTTLEYNTENGIKTEVCADVFVTTTKKNKSLTAPRC